MAIFWLNPDQMDRGGSKLGQSTWKGPGVPYHILMNGRVWLGAIFASSKVKVHGVGVIHGKKGLLTLRDESVARKSCKKTGSMMTQTQPPVVYSDMIMINVQVLD